MGWFTSLDPALVVATTERGDQLDLLVVPPQTPDAVARGAMAVAAEPTNTLRAPDVLAAAVAVPVPMPDGDADPTSVWDNEGGRLVDAPVHRHASADPDPQPVGSAVS